MDHTLSPVMWAHLLTVLPALLIGTVVMVQRKGTAAHIVLGHAYMLLMLTTAIGLVGDPNRPTAHACRLHDRALCRRARRRRLHLAAGQGAGKIAVGMKS